MADGLQGAVLTRGGLTNDVLEEATERRSVCGLSCGEHRVALKDGSQRVAKRVHGGW
mgnify:CR=1 FL=1